MFHCSQTVQMRRNLHLGNNSTKSNYCRISLKRLDYILCSSGKGSPKNGKNRSIYSMSCCFKPACYYFFASKPKVEMSTLYMCQLISTYLLYWYNVNTPNYQDLLFTLKCTVNHHNNTIKKPRDESEFILGGLSIKHGQYIHSE